MKVAKYDQIQRNSEHWDPTVKKTALFDGHLSYQEMGVGQLSGDGEK